MRFNTEKNSVRHSFRNALAAGAVVALVVALPLVSGCASTEDAAQTEDLPAIEADLASDAPSIDADADAPDADAAGADAEIAFSPSDGLDDKGHWEGVTALDYVTLPEYSAIEVPFEDVAVSEDEVQAQIDGILASYATNEQVTDRAIKDGDTVSIDYVGSIDGVEFEGGNTQGNGTMVTIGVTQYIDDFLEQLIGHKPGENFDIEVTFPEDYGNEELNGQDAVFNITINYINETVVPEATDEFVESTLQAAYGWTTVEQMREEIVAGLSSQRLDQFVQDYVFENSEVSEVPQEMVDYQLNSMVDYYKTYAAMYGLPFDQMLPMLTGAQTVDELIETNREGAAGAARSCLVIQAIAEDAGIEADDAAVEEYFGKMMGVADLASYEEQYGMPYLKLVTLNDAVVDYLATNAQVAEPVAAEADAAEDAADKGEAADAAEDAADKGEAADAAEDPADAADKGDAADAAEDAADKGDAADAADKGEAADDDDAAEVDKDNAADADKAAVADSDKADAEEAADGDDASEKDIEADSEDAAAKK